MAAKRFLFFAMPFLIAFPAAAGEEYQPLHPGAEETRESGWRRAVSGETSTPAYDDRRINVVRLKLPALPREESRVRLVNAGETPGGGLDFSPIRPDPELRARPDDEAIPGLVTPEQLALDQYNSDWLDVPSLPPESAVPDPATSRPSGVESFGHAQFGDVYSLNGAPGRMNDFVVPDLPDRSELKPAERKTNVFGLIELPPPLNEKATADNAQSGGNPPASLIDSPRRPALAASVRPAESALSTRPPEPRASAMPTESADGATGGVSTANAAAPGSLRPPPSGSSIHGLRPPATEIATVKSGAGSDGLLELTPFPEEGLAGTNGWKPQTPSDPSGSAPPFQMEADWRKEENRQPEIFQGYDRPVKWSELIPTASAAFIEPSDPTASAPEASLPTYSGDLEDGADTGASTGEREKKAPRPVSRRAKPIGITPIRELRSVLEPIRRAERGN